MIQCKGQFPKARRTNEMRIVTKPSKEILDLQHAEASMTAKLAKYVLQHIKEQTNRT